MIDVKILLSANAKVVQYVKGETIFEEGSSPRFYYQILEGSIKMVNFKEDGKAFIQGMFEENESFGEPPLFISQKFPASAIACSNCVIIKLVKEDFFRLLEENPHLYFGFVKILSMRLHRKATSNKYLSMSQPETKISAFFQNIKEQNKPTDDTSDKVKLTLTRQEIADSIGLRVETVIRTLKKMQKSKEIEIIHHKVFI